MWALAIAAVMIVVLSARGEAQTFECSVGENILYAGLRSGLALPYECGTGTCGTCKARLASGETASAWPEAPGYVGLKSGDILMCQTLAAGDCGVEVSAAMHHGGPYPATADAKFTSVGTAAILRFVRPVCYQSFPNEALPPELRDENPRNIWRAVEGQPTRDQVRRSSGA